MKTQKNILIAFILNISFSIFEIIGGILTNSVAILSDSIHDLGDAMSIGISYILERKSNKKPDKRYTYGYQRYSILGALITTLVLVIGSITITYSAILRIANPKEINYDGMIIFAIFGVVINFIATYVTREGESLNQKSVNLHMIEDVLGWVVVLIGSILMKFTDISLIDAIMSIGVATFILVSAIKNFKDILDLFLIKLPVDFDLDELKKHILEIKNVKDVHHIHVWSIDGMSFYATMHVKTNSKNITKLKQDIREELLEHNISHVTIEIEENNENCDNCECEPTPIIIEHHHHHH